VRQAEFAGEEIEPSEGDRERDILLTRKLIHLVANLTFGMQACSCFRLQLCSLASKLHVDPTYLPFMQYTTGHHAYQTESAGKKRRGKVRGRSNLVVWSTLYSVRRPETQLPLRQRAPSRFKQASST